jgi:hypothetical protein
MVDSARRVKGLEAVVRALGNRARPEISWLAKVTGTTTSEVEDVVASLVGYSPLVFELSENIKRTGRSYYAQFPAPIELYTLVRLGRPRTLVESGVASGVSSAFMLLGARANSLGTLHSIDYPVSREGPRGNESWAIPAGLSSGWAVPAGIRKGWDLRLGKSEVLLRPLLDEIGTLDFYCHDSPVDVRHFEFEMKAIRRHLKPGSIVVSDNTDRRVFDQTARAVGTKAYYRRGSSLGAFRVPTS